MKPLPRSVAILLNVGHALDHMFLLIFATAVATIAADFGCADWESLMPYGVGAFMLFGLGSLPAGRLGDLWGRRQMMLVFFFGMGGFGAAGGAARTNAWQLAAALTLMGVFSAIYHPVGIPMLVRGNAAARARDRHQRPVRQPRRRAGGGGDRIPRQVRRLARGVRRAGAAGDRLRHRVRARRAEGDRAAGEARARQGRRGTTARR